jgi:16S rRNA (adenine1518-N6/adenine1519-N6)-dimethyltransferase
MSKRKALGQHFLTNPRILEKILRCISPGKDDVIIEIGAGKGVLTFPLARKAKKVYAVEKDDGFIPLLKEKAIPNLKILHEDILKIELNGISKEKSIKLVGNLPYSISSPILFKVLAEKENISECFFLLQKEVAERIRAKPGTKEYAPLSIFFHNFFSVNLLFTVSPECFSPPPKVHSALISLKKREKPLFSLDHEELFLTFLKGSFRHRRKKLRNNLKICGFSPQTITQALLSSGIDQDTRAEQVTLPQFLSLFSLLYEKN